MLTCICDIAAGTALASIAYRDDKCRLRDLESNL
jgi:hypothetical protein